MKLPADRLTIEDVNRIAMDVDANVQLEIDPQALEEMRKAHELLLQAAREGQQIYGLNVGVGENKDKPVVDGTEVDDPAAKEASTAFNRRAMRAHSAALGRPLEREYVHAVMLVRLNTMLQGRTGATVEVAQHYLDFLNLGIYPVVPRRGTVGEGDITLMPHIGLAMMGEWKVQHDGSKEQVDAQDALERAGLESLVPHAKDALAVLSSNAVSASRCAILVHDAQRMLRLAHLAFAMSLEGLNGNVAPLLDVPPLRRYASQDAAAATVRGHLRGSYLWELYEGEGHRALQDPLSFRTASYVLGAVADELQRLEDLLEIQLNTSDDNPAVILGFEPPGGQGSQVDGYVVRDGDDAGSVIPTSNFEPLPWVLALQSLGVALSHLSRASTQRMVRLVTKEFTGLERFLAPDDVTLAYSAIQKPYMALDADNRALSSAVSMDALPVAGNIEDTATNSLRAVRRVAGIVANMFYILGGEVMHAAQAIELRRKEQPDLRLGEDTEQLLAAYRRHVPMLTEDRVLSPDIFEGYRFLRYGTDEILGPPAEADEVAAASDAIAAGTAEDASFHRDDDDPAE